MENQEKKELHFYGEKEFTYKEQQIKRRVALSGVKDGEDVIRIGVAICSEKDRFIRKKGRQISMGRAAGKSPEALLKLERGKGTTIQQFTAFCKKYLVQ